MYYLFQKAFTPAVIGISFFALILLAPFIYALCFHYAIWTLIATIAIVLVYIIGIILLWRYYSHNKDYYLKLTDIEIEIIYLDYSKGKTELHLPYSQIKGIEYYRLLSLKGWSLLFNKSIFPKSVYIEYKHDTSNITTFIGYLDYKDVKKIAKEKNIELKVH